MELSLDKERDDDRKEAEIALDELAALPCGAPEEKGEAKDLPSSWTSIPAHKTPLTNHAPIQPISKTTNRSASSRRPTGMLNTSSATNEPTDRPTDQPTEREKKLQLQTSCHALGETAFVVATEVFGAMASAVGAPRRSEETGTGFGRHQSRMGDEGEGRPVWVCVRGVCPHFLSRI
ncbi:hypothetical protein BKA81DRAFT_186914 [Phyllosticta paracitricarpa]